MPVHVAVVFYRRTFTRSLTPSALFPAVCGDNPPSTIKAVSGLGGGPRRKGDMDIDSLSETATASVRAH